MTSATSHSPLLRFRDLQELGLGRTAIRTGQVTKLHHDLYIEGAADLSDPDLRTRVALHIAGRQAHIGGWAAARRYELRALAREAEPGALQLFDGWAPWPGTGRELEPVLLCMNRDAKIRRPPQVRTLRSNLHESDIIDLDGLSITSPLRTAFDLARTQSRWHAVASVDRLAYLRIIDLEDLRDYVKSQERRHGIRRATLVSRLVSGRAESPPESITRMVWLEAGLPEPLVNAEVHDRSGQFVARVDLLDPRSRLVVEYDGAHHASAAQRQRDSVREQVLEELGYVVIKITAADLATHEARRALAARLVRAYRHAVSLNTR